VSSVTRIWILGGLAALVAALGSGCAATGPVVTKSKPPSPLSPDQKAQAIAHFEGQRDNAQLQAALNRWKEGNMDACERALSSLVENRPQFVDARVQYGEFLLAKENPAAAAHQLQDALKLAPDRADIHHSLGVALEAGGNHEVAADHFRKALALDPENQVYQVAAEGL